jgi:hypothetical protein
MKKLRISITDETGEVFEILTQDSKGYWYDSAGEEVAQGCAQLTRHALPDILDGASRWSDAK